MLRPVFLFLMTLLTACGRPDGAPTQSAPPSQNDVWQAILPLAERYRLDPAFVYALVAAESDFNPSARNGEARGLLQLKPAAWRRVSDLPYEPTVWEWKANLAVGVDYLAYVRNQLRRQNRFSYPRLLAAFHYGFDYVEARGFDETRLRVPDQPIYRELWRGNLRPVPPP